MSATKSPYSIHPDGVHALILDKDVTLGHKEGLSDEQFIEWLLEHFHTAPFPHQLKEYEKYRDEAARGLLWEQGVGKTKTAIDLATWLYRQGKIDAVLVVAPNGVHRNWISDEIPVHMAPDVTGRLYCHYYESKKAKTLRHQRECDGILKWPGLAFLAMSYQGFMTEAGKAFVKKYLTRRRVLYILDESHMVKTPSAKRTKTIVASGNHGDFRRILTGTPVANSPFDIFTQVRFLDGSFWKERGFSTFAEFKTHFGLFQKGFNGVTGREFQHCIGYRRLDKLHEMLSSIATRAVKDEVLDLPPKLYSKRYFDMTPEQARVYREIKNDALTLLASGDLVTAPLIITRLLRLQQVTCGYVPTDDGEDPMQLIDEKNPRLDLLKEICDGLSQPAIIWAKYRKDIDMIMEALGDNAVRYDGATSDDERAEAKRRFQKDREVQFFVANPAAGATGLTLHAAKTVIYYNNTFKLTDRLQSEDRAHRAGQEDPVDYIDIVAPGTVDVSIVSALRNKVNIASEVTGDRAKEWI